MSPRQTKRRIRNCLDEMKQIPAQRRREGKKRRGDGEKRRKGESINRQCAEFQASERRNVCRKMSPHQTKRRIRNCLDEMKQIPAQ
jgi:hypothetical protein